MDSSHREQQQASGPGSGRSEKSTFTIRDLAKEFGVTARTLRFYEEKGLVSPTRAGQERLFSRRDRARLNYVQMGKCVGFSLEEIREMLDLYDLGDRQITQLNVTLGKVEERVARLKRQKVEIDRALAELMHARKVIEGMLETRKKNADELRPADGK